MDERLVAQDQAHSQLVYDLAELTAQLAQMNRLLQSVDERLARLEEQMSRDSRPAAGLFQPATPGPQRHCRLQRRAAAPPGATGRGNRLSYRR
jgi:hypothetical protein